MDKEKLMNALKDLGEAVIEIVEALDVEEKDVISPSKLKAEAKKSKKAKEEDTDDLEIEEDTDEEVTEDVEEDEEVEEDTDEDVEEDTDEDDETVTELELKNLKKALKAYSDKHGKGKAVKILQKYAKASQDVKRKDFAKLLKMLKV